MEPEERAIRIGRLGCTLIAVVGRMRRSWHHGAGMLVDADAYARSIELLCETFS